MTDKKPLNDTEKKVLELYNSGMTTQKDIVAKIEKDKTTVSRALKHIRIEYPHSIKRTLVFTPRTKVVRPERTLSYNQSGSNE